MKPSMKMMLALTFFGAFISRPMLAAEMMDDPLLFSLMADQLEIDDTSNHALSWEGKAWLGRDLDKLWFKSEGEVTDEETEEAELQTLYGRAISSFWDIQFGVRHDFRPTPSQTWGVIGMQGLAPYLFETDVAFFLGDSGDTSLRVRAEYELMFTQRLILTPEIETNLYGQDIPEIEVGSGLSDLKLGFRLRYEIRREFAPYVGVEWSKKYGGSADFATINGIEVSNTKVIAGLRMWF